MMENLAKIQCTQVEAAAVLGVDEATFIRFLQAHPKAREAWDLAKQHGKASLRRHQFKTAENNPTMQIWLGKQYLDQTDKSEKHITGNAAPQPVQINVVTLDNSGKSNAVDQEPAALKLVHDVRDDEPTEL